MSSVAEIQNTDPLHAWNPDYHRLGLARKKKALIVEHAERKHLTSIYKDDPVRFILDFGITYDPRRKTQKILPFHLFEKQKEFILWLKESIETGQGGVVLKSRDMGATWSACCFSVWIWLYQDGSAVGWGSRKEGLVDRLSDPDSIFEKIRMQIKALPLNILPQNYDEQKHSHYMRVINPDNKATIIGEAGDNIGRGGRKSIFFKDEAQPLSAQVLTPTGWKTMADMKVGSFVIGADGEKHIVTQTRDSRACEVYRIGFSDGTYAEASENHLWAVDRMLGKKKSLILRTKQIAEDFVYHSPGGHTSYRYRLPVCLPVKFENVSKHPLDAYVVGALIGAGSVASVPQYGAKIDASDKEMVAEFKRLLPDGCSLGSEHNYSYNLVDIAGRQGRKKGIIRQAIVEAGITGCRSHEKFIPDAYKFASVKDRVNLLQGLMDTDGSASGRVTSFHTTSGRLANDVMFIVQSLGGRATLNVKPDKRGFLDMFVLHLALPEEISPFRISHKKNIQTKRQHCIEPSITSIEPVGKQDVRCISIDGYEGLYLTNDFIVTHNSAHYEHAEKIEGALSENTDVQIDISSVNGIGNVFYRRCKAPDTRLFRMFWRDHPLKTQSWYDRKLKKARDEGLEHIFRQEVDCDFTASVEGILIPGNLVQAAIDAHLKLKIEVSGIRQIGFDPYDGGGDRHALVTRHGILVNFCEHWGLGDTGDATRKVVFHCAEKNITRMVYDSIGVGAGVSSEIKRLTKNNQGNTPSGHEDKGGLPHKLDFQGFVAGGKVNRPESRIYGDRKNKDMFLNLKAQECWKLRDRFIKTHNAVVNGKEFEPDEIISLDSRMAGLNDLVAEISQPTRDNNDAGKIMINKKPKGTKSPNLFDALVMAFYGKSYSIPKGGLWI